MQGAEQQEGRIAKIASIDEETRRLITSGQVMTDVATAVKELVENALDAGATSIDVSLIENGMDVIEVTDNGSGVRPEDYCSLVERYATSKLRSYSELSQVESFGFRGEALASICEISGTFQVRTRHESSATGAILLYNRDGTLQSQSESARNVGTSIVIKELFKPFPVRRIDMERNAKKHMRRTTQYLQQYALCALATRIRFANTVHGRTTIPLAVQSGRSLLDTIRALWGQRLANTLTELPESVTESEQIRICGLVTKNRAHGVGKHETDRQLFFINNRPIEAPSKLVRALNESWRAFELNHKPAAFLFLHLPGSNVDVNLAPDKRKAVIVDEASLINALKSRLAMLWDREIQNSLDSGYAQSHHSNNKKIKQQLLTQLFPHDLANLTQSTNLPKPQNTDTDDSSYEAVGMEDTVPIRRSTRKIAQVDNATTTIDDDSDSDVLVSEEEFSSRTRFGKPTKDSLVLRKRSSNSKEDTSEDEVHDEDENSLPPSPQKNIGLDDIQDDEEAAIPSSRSKAQGEIRMEDEIEMIPESVAKKIPSKENDDTKNQRKRKKKRLTEEKLPDDNSARPVVTQDPRSSTKKRVLEEDDEEEVPKTTYRRRRRDIEDDVQRVTQGKPSQSKMTGRQVTPGSEAKKVSSQEEVDEKQIIPAHMKMAKFGSVGLDIQWEPPSSTADIIKIVKAQRQQHYKKEEQSEEETKINATAQSPDDLITHVDNVPTEVAEALLSKMVQREDFRQMRVVGQFNKGFIITILNNEVFIVDQHAGDEKYKYEECWRNGVQSQGLVAPLEFENAADELVALDNVTLFEKHGFKLTIDLNSPVCKRARIIALPVAKGIQFGPQDARELVGLLGGRSSNESMPRLPKLHSIFASKACRSSVMIGNALNKQQMHDILEHMSTMNHPWNCPHGRPTMRHLINTDILKQIAQMQTAAFETKSREHYDEDSDASDEKNSFDQCPIDVKTFGGYENLPTFFLPSSQCNFRAFENDFLAKQTAEDDEDKPLFDPKNLRFIPNI